MLLLRYSHRTKRDKSGKIAIAVVVENGAQGGRASAPIARLLMEKYLKISHNREAQKEEIMQTRYITSVKRSEAIIQ